MAAIITRRVRRRQPAYAEIDFGHPLANSLIFAPRSTFANQSPAFYSVNTSSTYAPNYVDQPISDSRSGLGVGNTPVLDIVLANTSGVRGYVEIPVGSDWTFFALVDNAAFGGTNCGLWRVDNATTTFCIFSGTTGMWLRLNGTDIVGNNGRPAVGSTYDYCMSVQSGKRVDGWVSGVRGIGTTTAATTPDLTGTGGVTLFGAQGVERCLGNYVAIYFWSRALEEAEYRALSDNPWTFYKARTRRLYFAPPSIVTAVFNPLSGRGGGAAQPLVLH